MTFVSDGPWKGQLLVANLRGDQVLKLSLKPDGQEIEEVEALFQDWGRIRNVYEGPDGSLYIMTNNRDGRGLPAPGDDKLFRLRPNF
jgi:glucose/arabinose dehydrogenase